MINGATCNGTNHSGCGKTSPVIKVGGMPGPVAVDQATDTIYVVNFAGRGKVSVINGATCDAANRSGCGSPHCPFRPTLGRGWSGCLPMQAVGS